METEDKAVEARVARGAALLDEKHPGWDRLIDLETLDMTSGTRCVLGQLYGTLDDGEAVLGLGRAQTARHGFICTSAAFYGCICGELAAPWRAEIARRLGSAPQA